MTGYVWNLSGTDRRCDSYGRGHRIHWIHFNHSMREPSVVIPVTAVLDDDGLVNIGGDDLSLVRWNHRPTLVRDALQRFGGMAEWRNGSHAGTSSRSPRTPSWEVRAPYSTSPAPTERRECYVIGTTNPAHLVPGVPSPTNVLHLRITARYTKGRPRPDGKPRPIPCPHRAHNLPTVTHMSSGLVWSPDAGRSPVDTLTCTSEMSSSLTEGTRNPRIQAICVPSAGKR